MNMEHSNTPIELNTIHSSVIQQYNVSDINDKSKSVKNHNKNRKQTESNVLENELLDHNQLQQIL